MSTAPTTKNQGDKAAESSDTGRARRVRVLVGVLLCSVGFLLGVSVMSFVNKKARDSYFEDGSAGSQQASGQGATPKLIPVSRESAGNASEPAEKAKPDEARKENESN